MTRLLNIIIALSLTSSITSTAMAAPTSKSKITVSGKVTDQNASDYKVVALQRSGAASSIDVPSTGKFKFKLKRKTAKGTSFHLVSASGQYFGPLVLPLGSKAVTQLSGKSSGNLGSITLGNGFATASKKGKSLFNLKAKVNFSSETGTLGSGKLGLVQANVASKANLFPINVLADETVPGADDDADGLVNLVDVDDDGDLILDGSDSDFSETSSAHPYVFNDLPCDLGDSINANAGQSITDSILDSFIQNFLTLVIGFNSGDADTSEVGVANVDCLNLPYCGTGGSAVIEGVGGIDTPDDLPVGSPWSQYDPDSDGLPNLYPYPSSIRREIIVKPSVPTSQISAGDTLLVKIALGGLVQSFPMVLSSVFATVPAVTSYSDGSTNGSFTYPISNGAAGTSSNPIQLSSTNLTLTFWRPQRRAIPGAESGTLIDMGGLKYLIGLSIGSSIINCTGDDYSNLSSDLSKQSSGGSDFLVDAAADSTPDSAKTLTFSLNLATCIARAGLSSSGQTTLVGLVARDYSQNSATQQLHFRTP